MKKQFLEIILASAGLSFLVPLSMHAMANPVCIICITLFTDRTEYAALEHHYKNFHNYKSRVFYLCPLCDYTGNAITIKYHLDIKHHKVIRFAREFDHVAIPRLPKEDTPEKEMRNYSNSLYSILEEFEASE